MVYYKKIPKGTPQNEIFFSGFKIFFKVFAENPLFFQVFQVCVIFPGRVGTLRIGLDWSKSVPVRRWWFDTTKSKLDS